MFTLTATPTGDDQKSFDLGTMPTKPTDPRAILLGFDKAIAEAQEIARQADPIFGPITADLVKRLEKLRNHTAAALR